MHKEAIHFVKTMSSMFPLFFTNKKVLDVGGGDINGNNRYLFNNCHYYCNDVYESPNVNCVKRTKDLLFENGYFDTIISTECFEHDPEYKESFLKIYDILDEGGLFIFTCASLGRPEHGTRKNKPHQSYGTIADIEDMRDYYKNLTINCINEIIPLDSVFYTWRAYYNTFSHDLYFIGFKKKNDLFVDKNLLYYNSDYVEEVFLD
jgi:SAM-dependent methyltransferase